MDNAELAIGIDLGTTNSLIAVWKDGAAQLIPNKFGEYLTPSIISMDENNHILVGKPAVSRRTSHPDKTAALFKRAMGSNTNWRLGSDTFNAPELSSLVLRSLKEDAEEFLQRPIKDVVCLLYTSYCVSDEISRDATRLHHHKSAVAPKRCGLRILLRNGAAHLAKTNNKTAISLHLAKLNVT